MASCCICFSAFKSNDFLSSPECGHVFHHTCLQTWLTTNWNTQTCPTCRHKITRGLLRRLHLNFDEDSLNNSIVHELQKSNINMGDQLKTMERKLASSEKKYDTLLKSKNTYQKRAATLKEDKVELNKKIRDLKQQLSDERKQRKFYENECLALTAQIDAMQDNW